MKHYRKLFLKTGDLVVHIHYPQWGIGEVVESTESVLAGGGCYVKVIFEDGDLRIFNNDLESEWCCYYFGIRRCDENGKIYR
ncbi:MAG: DUF3553 domain-containing protein [Deltaproteobacteria bacterium]|nr:MAG: DUF3553 domain-containing protein [Deltaproteobacteria bacterium]